MNLLTILSTPARRAAQSLSAATSLAWKQLRLREIERDLQQYEAELAALPQQMRVHRHAAEELRVQIAVLEIARETRLHRRATQPARPATQAATAPAVTNPATRRGRGH